MMVLSVAVASPATTSAVAMAAFAGIGVFSSTGLGSLSIDQKSACSPTSCMTIAGGLSSYATTPIA
jgi:hypothetical protein